MEISFEFTVKDDNTGTIINKTNGGETSQNSLSAAEARVVANEIRKTMLALLMARKAEAGEDHTIGEMPIVIKKLGSNGLHEIKWESEQHFIETFTEEVELVSTLLSNHFKELGYKSPIVYE